MMPIYALILAADPALTVDGDFMPLLPLPLPAGRQSAIEAICLLYRSANVIPLVVGAERSENLEIAASANGASFIHAEKEENGKLTGLQTGINALPCDCEAFFVHPADYPLVRQATIQCLLNTAKDQKHIIQSPAFRGQTGFPILVHGQCLPDMLPNGSSLSQTAGTLKVPTPDSFITKNMAKKRGYRTLCAEARNIELLSLLEAEELLSIVKISEEFKTHARAIGRVAAALAEAHPLGHSRNKNNKLNPAKALVGALMLAVRMAKPENAAQLLRGLGLERMAILSDINNMPESADKPFSEKELIFLAEKYVINGRFTPMLAGKEFNSAAGYAKARTLAERFHAETGIAAENIARRLLDQD